jgi:hypothetical protein
LHNYKKLFDVMKKTHLNSHHIVRYKSILIRSLKSSLILFFGMIISSLLAAELSAESKNTFEKQNPIGIVFDSETVYEETNNVHFGSITSVVVDNKSRVFMADNSQLKIHIFNPDGSYVRSLGRQGQGPGEFENISELFLDNKYLHVVDRMQRRISVFDLSSFALFHDLPISLGQDNAQSQTRGQGRQGMMGGRTSSFPQQVNLLSDGNYLVTFASMGGAGQGTQVVMDPDGNIIDTDRIKIEESEFLTSSRQGAGAMLSIPDITPTTFISTPGTGKLFANHNMKIEIKLFNEDGTLVRTFSKPYINHELKRDQVMARVEGGAASERLMAMLQSVELPEKWPAVNRMIADKQNRVWVSTNTEMRELKKWIVFDEHGNQLAEFTWPASKRVVHVQDNYLYTLEQDEFELSRVVKYSYKIDS